MSNQDKKVVGQYELVARHYKGAFRGRIWRSDVTVANVEGNSLEDVWRKLQTEVYRLHDEKVASRCGRSPTSEEAKDAFVRISNRLTHGHKAMLRAHLNAPAYRMTATELAAAARYRGYSAANLQYGLVGAMLFGEMPEALPKHPDGKPVMTCAIASGPDGPSRDGAHYVWTMRPHIAEGLRAARIL